MGNTFTVEGSAARRSGGERSEPERSRAAELACSPPPSPMPYRADSRGSVTVPKFTGPQGPKVNLPHAWSDPFEPDTFPLEGFTDEPGQALERDHPFAFDQAAFPALWIAPRL